ncbi:putative bifunctional diguanylate cyclase/phosphodiesterase [Peloplasma aerotolerans]|uniref:EAL domain-containing protein n=1 Tax=Peloplasma aerotolerans TaxID=3044389 RepID=A0AAW6U437_9MOLU|nr:EAL domain-containing protein [Mariniplasma sp. M4Ah]MDI6452736.1 EAL domain-containing protein [Mariniplasma sp. M4Ah]
MEYKPDKHQNDPRFTENQKLNSTAESTKIIFFYVLIGFSWILFSDYVIELIFTTQEALRFAQTAKGIFYVGFTAVIFYYIIHRKIDMYAITIQDLKQAYSALDQGHKKSLTLEEKLYDLAFYDSLTGLPNKAMLEESVNMYIKEHKEDGIIGFVYFDIDEFRNINEVKGHSVGDELIKKISSTLNEVIEKPHMLARMGGDEFVLALFDFKELEKFMPTIELYFGHIRKTFMLGEDDFFITYSAGVALYPDHGSDYITLLRHADAAMSIAKSKGRDQTVIFDDEMVILIKQQTELLNQLRQAISNEEFSLHYQPILSLKDDQVIGVEALIRWMHPEKGYIPPLEFISLSEKNGFIKEITEWVFKEAMAQYENWNIKKTNFKISINLSAMMLMNDKFITNLIKWIEEHQMDCRKFNIEITETAIIDDIQKSIHVLNQLKRLGFTIALDDFGTGYSSLTYLQKLPIDTIKIDRSFISNIKEDTEEFYVLKYMIDLAHHLNLTVVAEGIETLEQANMVKKYNVDFAQGYYYCKPMPQMRVLEYFKQNPKN